jgi:hypothetical protein
MQELENCQPPTPKVWRDQMTKVSAFSALRGLIVNTTSIWDEAIEVLVGHVMTLSVHLKEIRN